MANFRKDDSGVIGTMPSMEELEAERKRKEEETKQTAPEGTFRRESGGELLSPPDVVQPKTGMLQAGAGGFAQGLSYGGSDEAGSAIHAVDQPGPFRENYDKNQAEAQALEEAYAKEHPYPYYGGQVAGSVIGGVATAPARAVGAVRSGVEGATGGYLSGDTQTERLLGAGIGGVAGTAGGLVSPMVGTAAAKLALKVGRPLIDFASGLVGGPGGRRAAAKVLQEAGIPIEEIDEFIVEAAKRGQNLTPADMGGRPAALAVQTASTLNPEARMMTDELIQSRNATRGQRFRDYLTQIVPGFGNTAQERDLLQDASRKINQKNYQAAYSAAPSLITDELQDMLGIPAVRQAIADVTEKSANRAGGTKGAKPVINPFTKDADGNPVLKPGMTPSLEFWDHVARNLKDQAEDAGKGVFGGQSSAATDIGAIRNRLISELDDKVPAFGAARGEALKFFKANDALDLGGKLAGDSTMNPEAFQRGVAALGSLNPADRKLAQAGYLDALSHKSGQATNNADIARLLMGSDNDKLVQEALFGPEAAKNVSAFVKAEGLMQAFATRAGGGSPTTERANALFKALGLGAVSSAAGGAMAASSGLLSGNDEKMWGGAGGLVGGLAGILVGGARSQIIPKVAMRTAQNLLADTPEARQQLYAMMRHSPNIRDAITALAGRVGGVIGAEAADQIEQRRGEER